MSTTWILIANTSFAKLYANHGPQKGLELIKELDHPESREKGSDLVSDRPGHNQGHGNGHGSFVQATDPKQREAERFALELSKELEHGRTTNQFERLIIAASPSFMGTLKSKLPTHVMGMVSDSIEKDYTKAPEKELKGHLAHVIFL
jgi:protein required for attachment to host cells